MSVLATLIAGLDGRTRDDAQRRREALFHSVQFEIGRQSEKARRVVAGGWTIERLAVVCELAAFVQAVLGPLTSVTVANPSCGLGIATTVRFGSSGRVDMASRDRTLEASSRFYYLTEALGVRSDWLEAPTGEDLLFRIWTTLQ